MSLSSMFARQPRSWIVAEMAFAVLVIGVLDFVTGYKFRLLPFYAGPIFVIAWFFGRKPGIATALICGGGWGGADWFNGGPRLHRWGGGWGGFRHVGFFLVVGW